MKKMTALILLAMLVLGLCACSSSSDTANGAPMATSNPGSGNDSASMDFGAVSRPEAAEDSYDESGSDDIAPPYEPEPETGMIVDENRKLIWSGNMELETTDHDTAVEQMNTLVNDCGGFIQSSTTSGGGVLPDGTRRLKYSSFTVRVPAGKFQHFMNAGSLVATVLNSSTYADDVTDSYYDTEAHLKILLVKEERLLVMLEQGGELEYLLQVETELASTRYEIERLTSTLKRYDGLISYSTIHVYINEVRETTATPAEPPTVSQRISSAFSASVSGLVSFGQGLLVFVVGYSPVLLLIALIAAIIIWLVLKRRKSNVRTASAELPPADSRHDGEADRKTDKNDKNE